MTAEGQLFRLCAEVVGAFVLYRWAVSPAVRWGARAAGAGLYPEQAINGAYPTAPATLKAGARAVTAVLPLVILDALAPQRPAGGLGLVPVCALALVLWKALTADFDIAHDLHWQRWDRLATAAVCVGALVWPPLMPVAVVMLCGRLGAWTHHSMASLRLVKAYVAWMAADSVALLLSGHREPAVDSAAWLVLASTVLLSHYVVAFVAKLRLGRRPWDWAMRNRTETLVASSYTWGWARWLPERAVARVIQAMAPFRVLLNIATLVVEALGLAAFFGPWALVAALAGAAAFNVVVAGCSGLLFWENISMALVLAVTVAQLPDDVASVAFGWAPWLLSGVMHGLVLAGCGWSPAWLAWWDSPLAARVHWVVVTAEGSRRGLYNHLMSPHDREYGRDLGSGLTSEPFVTFPLGGVEDERLYECLLRASAPVDIALIKEDFGFSCARDGFREAHADYLRSFFARLNAGVDKSPLPRGLRVLKAPGSHLYRWGALPAYRRPDGPVAAVEAWHSEVYYHADRGEWESLREELVMTVKVGPLDARHGGP
ncbi:hypothetical protein [Streptomyces violascens]|uniref:Integral membrane protein n=1 Tax=Streptomyces violascens TaxID=67381 RepID=A0ABQ3QRL1_9ACTN|nr:hypothetical protein [Streptomyces violascens]GGU48379.1 hypothetical protein GCM10010289_81130 [Streptomyces violascens]GHI39911.1 hypothetical protein Sviol_43190 [Streptomyces violascens]